jgi:hypothetical protein
MDRARLLRRIATTVMLGAALPVSASAQTATTALQAMPFKTSFDIPDSPAFHLLEIDPATILKPQTARDLSLQLAKFQGGDGGFALPRAVAMEFSPVLLTTGNAAISKAQFDKLKALYVTRVSVAALRDSITGAATRLAVGLRATVHDQKCLKTDEAYAKELRVTSVLEAMNKIMATASDRAIKNRPSDVSSDQLDVYEAAAAKSDTFYTVAERNQLSTLSQEVSRRMGERYWNASMVELALAIRGTAADSTGRALQLDSFAAWATVGWGFGRWGQLLIGGQTGSERDTVDAAYRQRLSMASRLYAGSLRNRGFMEAQESFTSGRDASVLLNVGIEAAVNEWIWLTFSGGVESTGGRAFESRTSFRLKFGFPSGFDQGKL